MQAGALCLAGEPGLLRLLHLLEGPANVQQVGSAAELLLEEIAEAAGSAIQAEVDSLRSATRTRMRELALRNRQATLAAMGMQQVTPFTALMTSLQVTVCIRVSCDCSIFGMAQLQVF